MPGDGYFRVRQIFGDNSGSVQVAAGDSATKTLVTAKTNYTVNVQHVDIHIDTALAGGTWTVQDAASNIIMQVSTAVGNSDFAVDFGPKGWAVTGGNGSNLQLVISGAGAVGTVTWGAFQKLGSVISSAQAG